MPTSPDWLAIWYEALASQCGVVVVSDDVNHAKMALYRARSQSGDPRLDDFSIRTSPAAPLSELWLVRQRDSSDG